MARGTTLKAATPLPPFPRYSDQKKQMAVSVARVSTTELQ